MHKVASDEELRAALDEMFRHSSVLLAQEFIPTEFDWRIGLLDGEPLFACKYYMAKGHWQIYNHAHDDATCAAHGRPYPSTRRRRKCATPP